MNLVVAVSGGVDSVVLLDILTRQSSKQLIVAHVDHGIRAESAEDEAFVRLLAKHYQLPYSTTHLELGDSASEEAARRGRYGFLFDLARQHKATIVTAHHQDDVIGSIAINIQRGTGWRGLAVMNRPGIERPLIGWTKQTIYDYATKNRLEWVEDATNASDRYLRNRLRKDTLTLPSEARSQAVRLRARQLQLAREIDREIDRITLRFGDSRYSYGSIDQSVAIELLKSRFKITKPQAELALLAIKTARPGTTHVVDGGRKLKFTKTDFIVE